MTLRIRAGGGAALLRLRTARIAPDAVDRVLPWSREQSRMTTLDHFRQGGAPRDVRPRDAAPLAGWDDRAEAFGADPNILAPFPFRCVEEGDRIGRTGGSGRGEGEAFDRRALDGPRDAGDPGACGGPSAAAAVAASRTVGVDRPLASEASA